MLRGNRKMTPQEYNGYMMWLDIEKLADNSIVGVRLGQEQAADLVAYVDFLVGLQPTEEDV